MGAVGSESNVNDVNRANACDMSTCSDGAIAPNTSVNSCNKSVRAGSGFMQITLCNRNLLHSGNLRQST